jgi:hypothetical protein
MVREHWRPVLVAVGVVGVAAAIASGVLVATGGSSHERGIVTENGPASEAFARHEEDLFATSPNDSEGPTSAAEENYQLNGGDSITADEIAGARAASAAIAGRGVGKGKNSTTSWFSLGPTNAIYPAFLNRHGSQYNTSGRITALEISPECTAPSCTLWVGAAGGGVWRTNKALAGNANWVNVSDGSFASGAVGALTYDAAHHTLYAGTGEDAAAGDAEAGVGVYKSTDGGNTWTALGGNANFLNRAIRQIAVDPNDPAGNTIYVADGRGVHGISSTTAGAVSQIPPGTPGVGVWKSTDGGATFTQIQPSLVVLGPQPGQTFLSSFGSSRGATDVAIDPTHPGVIYATAYNVGVWRSTNNGASWTQIHGCQTCGGGASRSEFALATTPDGHTRMYQTEGDTCAVSTDPPNPCTSPTLTTLGTGYSRLWVANAVESGSPVFVDKTSANPADPGWATWNFCTGQCWYDELVYSPKGHPDTVFVMGSYEYGEDHAISNARGLLMSTDGGNTFTDMTDDATGTDSHHDGLHPDQHAFVTNPSDPNQFFEGSDGGLMRSSGSFSDISSRCDGRSLDAVSLARCKQLLSRVPSRWDDLNVGLDTLQFQSLSVNPADAKDIQGGTQDNGTFETNGSAVVWPQTIFGDGGVSGFDPTDRSFRFHTYFSSQVEVNFQDGHDRNWDWISDPFFDKKTGEPSLFYLPVITDPTVHGTMFAGLLHVWRTKDDGGPQAYLDSNCNRFTGTFTTGTVCGDWEKLGDPSLTSSARGTRAGGNVGWVSRASSDNSTLWAATTRGRLFVSKNADADPASAVSFTRIDTLAANSPGRPISSIAVDPANANHAYVSYLSYNALTTASFPADVHPGHVFSVTYDPVAGTATWVSLDGPAGGSIGDQPVNGVAYDPVTGDLYASTDFGVARLPSANPANNWVPAASGLPVVTVAGLTINPSARQLLAATHGRGAYQLTLP